MSKSLKYLLLLGSLVLSASTHATLIVQIDGGVAGPDSIYDFEAEDELSGDNAFPLPGAVNAFAIIEGSAFSITASSGAPDVGTLIDTNWVMTLLAGTSWVIRIADDGYELGNFPGATAFSRVTPTTIGNGHTITVETRINGQTVLSSDELMTAVNQSASAVVALSEPTLIEHIITMTAAPGTAPGTTSTFDTATSVPEPGIITLLGGGLLAFGLVNRRRRVRT